MTLPFCNQEAAREYAETVEDRVERVWVEYVLSRAVVALIRQHNEHGPLAAPLDLLLYVKLSQAAFGDHEVVQTILSGKYEHFRDIPDLF